MPHQSIVAGHQSRAICIISRGSQSYRLETFVRGFISRILVCENILERLENIYKVRGKQTRVSDNSQLPVCLLDFQFGGRRWHT